MRGCAPARGKACDKPCETLNVDGSDTFGLHVSAAHGICFVLNFARQDWSPAVLAHTIDVGCQLTLQSIGDGGGAESDESIALHNLARARGVLADWLAVPVIVFNLLWQHMSRMPHHTSMTRSSMIVL